MLRESTRNEWMEISAVTGMVMKISTGTLEKRSISAGMVAQGEILYTGMLKL